VSGQQSQTIRKNWSVGREIECVARQANQLDVVSSRSRKNSSLSPQAKSVTYVVRLTQLRGGSRSSRTCGEMRWTRKAHRTCAPDAYGEVVWF
jgi:hypothetical protein